MVKERSVTKYRESQNVGQNPKNINDSPTHNFKSRDYSASKGPSIYYVIRDGGGGVFPIYYNIT